tara:strand:- start:30 stop:794 length:765 start_codon:yes stop_codon:yes gene_type:complete
MSKVKTLIELTKFVTAGVEKALSGRGKLSRANNALIKRQANKADMPVPEFKQKARQIIKNKKDGKDTKPPKGKNKYPSLESLGKPKAKKTPTKKDKGSQAGLTPAQKAEKAKLIKQSKAANKRAKAEQEGISKVILPTREQTVRGVEGRKGLQRPQIVESPSGRLKSKQEIDTTGFTKAEKFKQKLQPHADPASVIQQEMRGTGQTMSAKEAEDLGLTIKKYGGMIKKNMGGPVRGVGKAIKGFGNATYSKKMY